MIKETIYLSRLTNTYIFIRDMVSSVNDEFVYERAISSGEGVREIIIDPLLWNGSVPSESKVQELVEQVVKKKFAEVSNYKKWILGLGLIMTCAIFDDFLNELLKEILNVNPKFTNWNDAGEILVDFDKKTIDKKYKVFINKLGFTKEEFFDFSIFNLTIQQRLRGSDINTLNKIYSNRHKAAHSDGYALSTIEELANINMLFEKLMWNLSLKCRRKLSMESELVEMIASVQNSKTKEASS